MTVESPPQVSPPSAEAPLMAATGVTKIFGGLVAVNDVSFTIPPKSIVSIIGPNGAGKTTFFNMLTGLYKPSIGTIEFDGLNITGGRPDRITAHRSARTFRNTFFFNDTAPTENVMVGRNA